MRLLNLGEVTCGMRLGEAVRGAVRHCSRGVVITQAYIDTLRSLDMPAVYVTDAETANIEFPHPCVRRRVRGCCGTWRRRLTALSEATEQFRLSSMDLGDQNLDREKLARAVSSSGAPDCLYTVAKDVDFLLDELGNLRGPDGP